MAEELSLMCGNLSLSEEEEIGVTLQAQEVAEIGKEGELCLVGGLIVEKPFNREAFKKTMASVWGLVDSVVFHEVGDSLFIIKFRKISDLSRIWEGQPWLFDRNLSSYAVSSPAVICVSDYPGVIA